MSEVLTQNETIKLSWSTSATPGQRARQVLVSKELAVDQIQRSTMPAPQWLSYCTDTLRPGIYLHSTGQPNLLVREQNGPFSLLKSTSVRFVVDHFVSLRSENSDHKLNIQPPLERLIELLHEDEIDERGLPLRPTNHAFDQAWRLLVETSAILKGRLSDASVSVDESGGIRVEWREGARQVRLIIASSKIGRNYIYRQNGKSFSISWNVDAKALANHLDWIQCRAEIDL